VPLVIEPSAELQRKFVAFDDRILQHHQWLKQRNPARAFQSAGQIGDFN